MPPSIPQRYATAVAIMWQRARAIVMAALMLTLTSPTAYAQIAGSPQRHIASELAVERPAAPGGTVMLAIHMTPEPGWHGYWQNPGDAGFGMRLDWHLPKGARTASPLYPVPEALLVSGLMNHVVSHDYAVLVPLTLPADAPLGASLPVSVTADYLVCTQTICVPEQAHLATRITIAQGPQSPSPSFSAWRAKLPAPLGASAHLALASGQLRIAIPFPATTSLSHPHLFLIDDGLIQYAAPQHFARGPKSQPDTLIATLAANPGKSAPPALHAVLRLDDSGAGLLLDAQPGPVPADGAVLTDEAATHTPALGWLVLAALAGGLLLNVMPCVFPILSLKALSLARAGESAADARTEGLAYAAGTIVACAALGALLLALSAGGEAVGWAFQLQHPAVVAALIMLATAITANLAGLYELAVPGFVNSRAGTARSAFATGLLAAFVGTPCTGPFMAGAMGAALLLPVPLAMVLFVALGLGMALPFLAIALIPPLRARLPRPGRWMNALRRVLAVPMGLTGLALVWLASRLGGWSFAGGCVVLALGLLGLLAMLGRGQRRGQTMGQRFGLPLALGVVAGALVLPYTLSGPQAAEAGLLPARPYSAQALAIARAKGPVFAYFTADWCLSCKVNERIAIETPATRDAFAAAHVTVLKGDWTRRDGAITAYLDAHGAAGVPLYVWYARGADGEALAQVLTPDTLPALARQSR